MSQGTHFPNGADFGTAATGKGIAIQGVDVTATAAELNKLAGATVTTAAINALIQGIAGGFKVARGQLSTASAADTVATGLATVVAVVATIESDVDGVTLALATAQVGDQAGAPAAGSVVIKTWKNTSAANPTLIAATVFAKKVNWVAIGT